MTTTSSESDAGCKETTDTIARRFGLERRCVDVGPIVDVHSERFGVGSRETVDCRRGITEQLVA